MEWLATITHPIRLYQDSTLTVSFVLSSIIYLTICFVLLGVTASDYLCPNVAAVAEPGTLRSVDPGMASSGALVAILLSWCNSAPDLFSNLLSWTSANRASASAAAALSVGEVIGSSGVILCVVQGAIFMLMGATNDPIRLSKRQRIDMLRDTAFVLVAMLLLTYVSIRNRVSVMNCMVMVLWYGVYIFTKFKQQGRSGTSNGSDDFTRDDSSINNNGNSGGDNNLTVLPEAVMKPSIIEAMDFTTLLNLLEHSSNENDDDDDDGTRGQEFIEVRDHGAGIPSFPLVLLNQTDGGGISVQGTRQTPHSAPVANREFVATYSDTRQTFSSPASVPFAPYSDDPESVSRSEFDRDNNGFSLSFGLGLGPPFTTATRERIKLGKVLIKMFVPHMANYRHKSAPDWILSIVTAPFVILLQISCPKPIKSPLDYEGNSPKYNYTILNLCLLMGQSLLAPTITLLLISCLHENSDQYPKLYFNWLLPVSLTVVSVPLLAILVYLLQSIHRYNRFHLPRYLNDETDAKQETRRHIESATTIIRIAFPLLGIINSILYISLIANALVETLQLYQQLTEVSEAILGLTLFAWGNSISDLISNVAMCRLYRRLPARNGDNSDNCSGCTLLAGKFFVIACSSCIGGVMLNSMGGIGLSGLVAMLFVHGGSSESSEWWFLRYTDLHETLTIDYKFVVSCFGLGVVVLVMAVSYGLGGRYFKWIDEQRWAFGMFMCGVWGVVTLCNVCLETF